MSVGKDLERGSIMSAYDSMHDFVSNLDTASDAATMADSIVSFIDEIEAAHDFEEQEYYESSELVYGYWF